MDRSVESTDTLLSRNEIPVIDFAFKESISTLSKSKMEEISTQMNHAFTTNGFAFLINHGISEERINSVFKIMKIFCSLPDSIKDQYKMIPPDQIQGYIPPGMEMLRSDGQRELKHSYNIVRVSEELPTKEIDNFREVVEDVIEDLVSLTFVILEVIAEALDFDSKSLVRLHQGMMKQDNLTALRLLYYPPVEEEETGSVTRCGEHTDWGSFTLLAQDVEGGLEVFQDGEWRRVGHFPGAILMNVGDMMEVWSSSKYKSALHRVVVSEEAKYRGRFSTAFFVHPDITTLVDPSALGQDQSGDEESGPMKLNALEYIQRKRTAALELSKPNEAS